MEISFILHLKSRLGYRCELDINFKNELDLKLHLPYSSFIINICVGKGMMLEPSIEAGFIIIPKIRRLENMKC